MFKRYIHQITESMDELVANRSPIDSQVWKWAWLGNMGCSAWFFRLRLRWQIRIAVRKAMDRMPMPKPIIMNSFTFKKTFCLEHTFQENKTENYFQWWTARTLCYKLKRWQFEFSRQKYIWINESPNTTTTTTILSLVGPLRARLLAVKNLKLQNSIQHFEFSPTFFSTGSQAIAAQRAEWQA